MKKIVEWKVLSIMTLENNLPWVNKEDREPASLKGSFNPNIGGDKMLLIKSQQVTAGIALSNVNLCQVIAKSLKD